jgi:asparagine synthase (glutamine-hydrolysing)
MSGIAGIIGDGLVEEHSGLLAQMLCSMNQNPSCTCGFISNQELGLSIGWNCRKDLGSSCLPLWNETRDIFMVFVGEDFPEESVIARLRLRGHSFPSDYVSHLIHSYEEQGDDFLRDINGRFCGVLVDLRIPKAFLFNDRFGLSRIYYHERGKTLYFASEAKSLLKILPDLRHFDPARLGEFFSCGCSLGNKSLFSRISIFPGGSKWEFTPAHGLSKGKYFWAQEWEDQPVLTQSDYYAKLKQVFVQILPRYLRGDGQVGMSLTGGLDSRMIMAWAPIVHTELPCYTFNGTHRDCIDVKLARLVAKASKQPHEVITVGSDFPSRFPTLAERTIQVSDGAMDISGSVELYVNLLARQVAPIRLTGNYGSEVLRGSIAFKPTHLRHALFDPDFVPCIHEAAQTYANEAKCRRESFILFKQIPWHHYARLSVEQSEVIIRTPYLDNELACLAYQAPEDLQTRTRACMQLVADGNPDLTLFGTDRSLEWHQKATFGKLQRIYRELTIRAEYAFDYGMPQWLSATNHLLAPLHLERLFLGRHKFYHFRIWYQTALASYVKEILLDPQSRGRPYLRGDSLERIVTSHLGGVGNYTLEIHRLLTAELIQRLLIEHVPASPKSSFIPAGISEQATSPQDCS